MDKDDRVAPAEDLIMNKMVVYCCDAHFAGSVSMRNGELSLVCRFGQIEVDSFDEIIGGEWLEDVFICACFQTGLDF
jgi:hypothetical protein